MKLEQKQGRCGWALPMTLHLSSHVSEVSLFCAYYYPICPFSPTLVILSQCQHTARTRTSKGQLNCSGHTVSTCHQTLSCAMFWVLRLVWSQHAPG